jgi:hypothetical protein
MSDAEKLALLAKLLPYVSDDDGELNLQDFARMVADRAEEDLNGDQ